MHAAMAAYATLTSHVIEDPWEPMTSRIIIKIIIIGPFDEKLMLTFLPDRTRDSQHAPSGGDLDTSVRLDRKSKTASAVSLPKPFFCVELVHFALKSWPDRGP